jgi:hypothetical protein
MGFSEIRRFKDFYLTESRNYSPSVKTLGGNSFVNEDSNLGSDKKGKEESYRSIAYKLSEIFGLYGFFFALKPGFFDPDNWPKLMDQIIKVKDPAARWDTITKMSKFLQQKVASLSDLPIKAGEFGARGQYDYGQETENLPQATEFLKSASNAAFKGFTPDEKTKAMGIMDGILGAMKPLSFQKNPSFVSEAQRFEPPTPQDLLRLADSIGAKLLNMYDMLDNLAVAYPDSKNEVVAFQDTYIVPNVNKIKSIMQNDIPNVGVKAAEGYYKKLQKFDGDVSSLIPKADALRQKLVATYQPIAAASEFEDSAQNIIDKVRQGILKQAETNIRWKKSTDVIAGSTDINDPRYSGDAQVPGSDPNKAEAAKKAAQKKRNIDDLSDFLAKKYTPRK